MLEFTLGLLSGVIVTSIASYLARMISRSQATVAYKKGWDAATEAHARDFEPIAEGLYDHRHPNPLHIPIGGKICYDAPYGLEPSVFEKVNSTTFQSGEYTLSIDDLARTELDGASWSLME